MRSTNHRKYPTRSYRNDYDFASFGDSSASVLSTRNPARFDGEFSATGQIGPAETILSGRAIALARKGCIQENPGLMEVVFPAPNASASGSESIVCCPVTLFDSVMNFLDRHERMAAQLHSINRAD